MIAISSTRLWAVVLLGMLSAMIALASQGLSLDVAAAIPYGALMLSVLALSRVKAKVSGASLATMVDVLEGVGLITTISAVGGVASYAIAAASVGYVDRGLAAADLALGFDWMRLYEATRAHTLVSLIMVAAYKSVFWTPLALIVLHVRSGADTRLRAFFCIFSLCLFVTVVLFYWFPAQSAVPYHLGGHTTYVPPSGWPTSTIDALRDGGVKVIDINDLIGMVTFPSFHAASAVIFIWGALPFRRARKVLIPVNVMMVVATPVEGSHYLVDVVAGSSLALVCIALAYTPAIRRMSTRLATTGRLSLPAARA